MAGERTQFVLGDLCSLITDGKHGDCDDEPNSGFYFLSVKDVLGNRLVYENARQITKKDFLETHRRTNLEPDDVLFTNTGTIGRMAVAPRDPRTYRTTFQKSVAILKPRRDLIEPSFLYYLLHFDNVRLSDFAAGTTQKNLLLKDLRSFAVEVPDLPEQRAIAHILGRLDDKIELNRRMNETLEAMARALFKSWFVDFLPVRAKQHACLPHTQARTQVGDPVLAKTEGRDPLSAVSGAAQAGGLPPHLAALFPDRLEDSELGEIPAGWKVASIGQVADVIDCLHSKKPERQEDGLPLLQLSNIRDDGLVDMRDPYLIRESDYRNWVSRMEASPGDCVITNVGRVGAVAQMAVGQKAALGRNMTGIRCKAAFPYPTVLIECLLSQATRDEILLRMDTGTILDALNVRSIPGLRFVRAGEGLLERFEAVVRPVRQRMEQALVESRTLAALRDALLPKLISGEIRVRDAERFTSGMRVT